MIEGVTVLVTDGVDVTVDVGVILGVKLTLIDGVILGVVVDVGVTVLDGVGEGKGPVVITKKSLSSVMM